ncbi:hypothetical protein PanWU01x14_179370 [Parasponia andersonii]|uniref:Uncharacterized protein n=1 Tax=Parasponia andersonii TaxID=3476 RepID=A0A2P5C6Q5_PARAD|nr:hypothetical protein PanWU01x14_179370 [Parasponia andersonii]
MDKTAPRKEVPEEVTRESLISISYSLPEKVVTSKPSTDKVNGGSLIGGVDSDGEDKFRSELISISYTQSPDVGGLPVALEGELKEAKTTRSFIVYINLDSHS